MKKNSIALLVATSVISVNSFAYQSMNDIVKSDFLKGNNPNEVVHLDSMIIKNNAHVNTSVVVTQAGGYVNSSIHISSHHDVFLSNPYTDHSITYHFAFNLCAEKRGCINLPFEKSLAPLQIYTEDRVINGSVAYDKPGNYLAWGETTVTGDFPDGASGNAQIYVYSR